MLQKSDISLQGKLQEFFRAGLNEIKYDYADSKQHFYLQYRVAATDMTAHCKKQTTLQAVAYLGFPRLGTNSVLGSHPARSWQQMAYEAGGGRHPGLKNSGKTLFTGEAEVAEKILKDKKYFNTVKNFRANSVLQGKRRLLKILNDKKIYIKYSEFRHTLFSGQAQVAQKS